MFFLGLPNSSDRVESMKGSGIETIKQRVEQFADRFVPDGIEAKDPLLYWRHRMYFTVVFSGLVIGLVIFLLSLPLIFSKSLWGLLIYDLVALGTGLVVLLSRRLSIVGRGVISLALLYATGMMICLNVGVLSGGPAWLFCCAVFAGVFFGVRAVLLVLLLNALSLLSLGGLALSGMWGAEFPFFTSIERMLNGGINYIFISGVTAVFVSVQVQGLLVARQKEKEMALSLKQSNDRFHSLANAAMEGILFVHKGRCLQANQTAVGLFGFSSAEKFSGMPLAALIDPAFHDRVSEQALEKMGAPLEMVARRTDESTFPVSVQSRAMIFEDLGQVFVVTMEDLTMRKRSDRIGKTLLAISNAVSLTRNLEDLFSQIHHLMGKVMDTTNFFIALVDEKEKTLSFSYFVDEQEPGTPAPTKLDAKGSLSGLVAQKQIPMILEREALVELAQKNNVEGPLPLIWMGVPLIIRGNVIGVTAVQSYRSKTLYDSQDLAIFESVSGQIALAIDRKRSEDALRESEAKYRHLFDNAPAALYEIDFPGRKITNVNAAMCSYTGYSSAEFLTMAPMDFLAQESLDTFYGDLQQVMIDRPVSRAYDYKIKKKNGEILSVILNAEFVYESDKIRTARVVVHDITERKKIEEMMARSEKMMSIGGLAAGMAHEINNPLAGMIQNAQVISNRLSKDLPANLSAADALGLSMSDISAYMEKRGIFKQIRHINEAGRRAAKIVENMLSFAGNNSGQKKVHSLEALLEDTLDLARNDYDLKKKYDIRKVEIVREYCPVSMVQCQGSKVQQVYFNLIRNAVEAMASTQIPMPRLTFRINEADRGVRVEIEDNGPGMDDRTRKRVFEPFFTTKGVDQGTGLGLAISYYIVVEDHGGQMDVISAPGQGCRFEMIFPLS